MCSQPLALCAGGMEGLAFERVCLWYIEQVKRALQIGGVLTTAFGWRHRAGAGKLLRQNFWRKKVALPGDDDPVHEVVPRETSAVEAAPYAALAAEGGRSAAEHETGHSGDQRRSGLGRPAHRRPDCHVCAFGAVEVAADVRERGKWHSPSLLHPYCLRNSPGKSHHQARGNE